MRFGIALATASLVVCAVPALAGPWTVPNAALPGILEYYNGGDLNGHYGDPTVQYNSGTHQLTLEFLPQNFVANSSDGVSGYITDTLSVDIKINPLLIPTYFDVSEGGAYSMSDPSTGSVLNSSNFSITPLSGNDPQNPVIGTSYDFGLNYQQDTPFGGFWISSTLVDTAFDIPVQEDLAYFRLSLHNELFAESTVGETSSISKLGTGVKFTIQLIPEPSSLALLAFGLLGALRRR
jgi:hypothetical protein